MPNFDPSVVAMLDGEEKPRPRETQFWSVIFILTGLALLVAVNSFLR